MLNGATFDFIVVGGGAAGCTAAARLAESGRHSVLLIEAGDDDNWIWLKIPLGIGIVLTGKRALWRYHTEPEPQLASRRIFWPRGRVLGGTSTVNGMLWVRGDPCEYNRWAEMGNKGWAYDDLLPYFKGMEHCEVGQDTLRGRTGNVNIVEYTPRDPLSSAFLDACHQAGIPKTQDYNGKAYEGVGFLQLNTKRGFRHGVREAYLRPIMGNRNITIMPKCVVQSIAVENKRAIGVNLSLDGKSQLVKANHEVILTAGAINSPQLLELSGIGDAARLKRVGIDLIHHLPGVGEGLRDHLHTRISYRCKRPFTLNDIMQNPLRKALFGLQYFVRRNGLMASSTATVHALACSSEFIDRPDIKLQLHPLSATDTRDPTRILFDPFPGFGIGTFALQPKSTGSVHIASAHVSDSPIIKANYLAHPDDLATAIAAVRLARKVANQAALAHFIEAEIRPGPIAQKDEEVAHFIRQTGTTSYHPIGTCRMGIDVMAVVDPTLKLNGMKGLRVADASIFPTMPSSNTHAPSILVGEVAATHALIEAHKIHPNS